MGVALVWKVWVDHPGSPRWGALMLPLAARLLAAAAPQVKSIENAATLARTRAREAAAAKAAAAEEERQRQLELQRLSVEVGRRWCGWW